MRRTAPSIQRTEPAGAPIRILIVEDSEDDALLVLRELRHAGYTFTHQRVETMEALNAALEADAWDVIISDYRLHGFTGLDALRRVQETGQDIPFILVSGVMGEDVAVEAMKAGCHDYVMKGRLARLGPAIERELQEAQVRRARVMAERALRQRMDDLAALYEATRALHATLDTRTMLDQVCRLVADRLGLRLAWVGLFLPADADAAPVASPVEAVVTLVPQAVAGPMASAVDELFLPEGRAGTPHPAGTPHLPGTPLPAGMLHRAGMHHPGDDPISRALQTRNAVLVNDLVHDPTCPAV